jgi:hypothetical protein
MPVAQTAPKPAAHALLGASSAERWLHCTPSARLEEKLPDTQSVHARLGSLAHELAALRLQQSFQGGLSKRAYTAAKNKLLAAIGPAALEVSLGKGQSPEDLDPETRQSREKAEASAVENAVGAYVDLVKDECAKYAGTPIVYIEQKVDFSRFVPEGFGTCDCLTVGRLPDGRWQMHVFDYKNGKGVPVEAEHNPQIMLYGLGALTMLSPIYPIAEVVLSICQPNLNSQTHWTVSPDELEAWGVSIMPTAQQAFNGEGETREGDWCHFCRAATRCRRQAERFTALEDFGYRTPTDSNEPLTDEELGTVLTIGERLDRWLSKLREYVQEVLLNGGEVPGWKMVEGRAVRAFADQETAFGLAKVAGVEEALLYERRPISLTALEGLMGKKAFAETLESQITRNPGKPTLVPEKDPRPAMVLHSTAEEDFGEVS